MGTKGIDPKGHVDGTGTRASEQVMRREPLFIWRRATFLFFIINNDTHDIPSYLKGKEKGRMRKSTLYAHWRSSIFLSFAHLALICWFFPFWLGFA